MNATNTNIPFVSPRDDTWDFVPAAAASAANLPTALQQWERLLGSEHVSASRDTLDQYARSTSPKSTRPAAVLWPSTTREVQEVVRISRANGLEIHAVSCGKNWGYGDMCASTDGQVIVHLSRMNRIVEVNEELAYAVVEPGVTQQQMYEYLRDHKLRLRLDVTGAGPDASIIGNTLQRGFGHTPYGDHFAHFSGMQVVLRDGSLLNTGFGAFPNAKAAHVFPWGIGPWVDGLFSQSDAGIVTKMGVWLLPEPEVCQAFAFKVADDERIGDIVEALRGLRLHDVVRSAVHVANDLRVISAHRQYPWELTGGVTPLPHDARLALRHAAGIGAWNVMGGLYGSKATVAAGRRLVRRAMRGIAHVHFFGEAKLQWGLRAARLAARLGLGTQLLETVESAQSVLDLLHGIPSVEHLKGVFWRSKTAPDRERPDPSQAGCMWISPVLPMTAQDTEAVLGLVTPIFERYGFEPLITFTAMTSRALVGVMTVSYDRSNAKETEEAQRCYDSLLVSLVAEGYIPYRTSVHTQVVDTDRLDRLINAAMM